MLKFPTVTHESAYINHMPTHADRLSDETLQPRMMPSVGKSQPSSYMRVIDDISIHGRRRCRWSRWHLNLRIVKLCMPPPRVAYVRDRIVVRSLSVRKNIEGKTNSSFRTTPVFLYRKHTCNLKLHWCECSDTRGVETKQRPVQPTIRTYARDHQAALACGVMRSKEFNSLRF